MKEPINAEEFLKKNKEAFYKIISTGKRSKKPRTKPRSEAEYFAIGRAVVEKVARAKAEGIFSYDSKKGIIWRWKD